MSVADAIRTAHSATPEPLKVFTGTFAALTFSYAGVMDFLRLILLIVTIAYTTVKLIDLLARRHDHDRDDDE